MPGIDGKRCLEALRNIDPKVRVLISIGHSTLGITEDLNQAWAMDLLGEPFAK
jgi:hypothetical protein